MINLKELWKIKNQTKEDSPLIHCITNPISINGCANVVLALGGKPIMAEHPREVEQITEMSKALAVNLGNITDARIESIYLSGLTAQNHNIPHIIDLVGVGISPFRLEFAKEYIKNCKPDIIKGNMSEIKTILDLPSSPMGIDVGEDDKIEYNNLVKSINIGKDLALKTNSTVVISGQLDIITDGNNSYIVKNGVELLSSITGTGCMLNTLIASLMPYGNPLFAALVGTLILTISGELSKDARGSGSFMVDLIDNIYSMNFEQFSTMANYEIYKE